MSWQRTAKIQADKASTLEEKVEELTEELSMYKDWVERLHEYIDMPKEIREKKFDYVILQQIHIHLALQLHQRLNSQNQTSNIIVHCISGDLQNTPMIT